VWNELRVIDDVLLAYAPQLGADLQAWPNAGFHRRLAQLAFERLRSHPLSPLPMLRW
jgi:hypothetical protein